MDILMVVAQDRFRDEEFQAPLQALEAAGHRVIVVSQRAGQCTGTGGTLAFAVMSLAEVHADRFDGAVFVGGPGARALFDDADAHRIALELSRAGRLVGAICIAPVILARAGVLIGRRAAVFPAEREALLSRKALPVKEDVVVDGKVVTASGPRYAEAFGAALVEVLSMQRPRPQGRIEGPRL
jgi:protease I